MNSIVLLLAALILASCSNGHKLTGGNKKPEEEPKELIETPPKEKEEPKVEEEFVEPPVKSEFCIDGDTIDYSEEGPYGFKKGETIGGHPTYIPSSFGTDCKHPVISFAPGIGMHPSNYSYLHEHLASWGFIVVIDPNFLINSLGTGLISGIKEVYDSEYSQYAAKRAGVTGHSMGGGASLNASPNEIVDAVVAIQPGVSWTTTKKATLYLGGTRDMFGSFTDPENRFENASGPKFFGNYSGAGHIVDTTNAGNAMNSKATIAYKGSTTAWFRCYLSDDSHACDFFKSEDICSNWDWADCVGNSLR